MKNLVSDVSLGVVVSLCEPSGLWCCKIGGRADSCCNNVTNLFSLEAATQTLSSHFSDPTTSGSRGSISSFQPLSATTSGSTSSISSFQPLSSTTSGSLSFTQISLSSSTAIDTSISSNASSGLPISGKAGIGFGVPLVVALLVLLVYLIYDNKRLRTAIKDQSAQSNPRSQEVMMIRSQQQMDTTHHENFELSHVPQPYPELA